MKFPQWETLDEMLGRNASIALISIKPDRVFSQSAALCRSQRLTARAVWWWGISSSEIRSSYGAPGNYVARLSHPLIFQTNENVCAKGLFWVTYWLNRSMSGRKRTSGMLGINS
jgi:hypothetical protein